MHGIAPALKYLPWVDITKTVKLNFKQLRVSDFPDHHDFTWLCILTPGFALEHSASVLDVCYLCGVCSCSQQHCGWTPFHIFSQSRYTHFCLQKLFRTANILWQIRASEKKDELVKPPSSQFYAIRPLCETNSGLLEYLYSSGSNRKKKLSSNHLSNWGACSNYISP